MDTAKEDDGGLTANDRLRAELAFNSSRADHEPVTDSSLTYGDLRAMQSILAASPAKLADMLREAEPDRQPDGSDTLMEISVEDARRIAWALVSGKCAQTSDIYREALESIDAVGVDFGHFETAARTMQEICRKALFGDHPKALTDEERIAYWKGAYDRMAARNIELSTLNAEMTETLDHIGGLSRALRQGGPDLIDLHGLSDALSEAVELANTVVAKAEMASEIAPSQPDLATALLKQLTRLSAGSCTCGAKSPDIQWHDGGCKFRLAEEIRENVEALEERRAEQWRMRREAEASRDVALAASVEGR